MFRAQTLLPLVFLVGCSGGDDDSQSAHLIAVLPYTGTYEVKGPIHEAAVRMAVEELVEAGANDALGRRFNVVPVNSGDGEEVVQELVRDVLDELGSDVLGIVTSTGDAHKGVAPVAIEFGIPTFETSSGAHDDEFLDWSEYTDEELSYLMSSRPLCNYEAVYTAELIMEKWPNGRVALFRGDKTHDKMHTGTIRQTLISMGFTGTIIESNDPAVAGDDTYEGNDQDFLLSYEALEAGGVEAAIQAVVDEHQPDVMFFHLRGDAPNLRFVQDTQRTGYAGTIVTCGMARNSTFIDPNANGLISDYLVGYDAQLDDARFYFVNRAPLPSAKLDTFRADFLSSTELESDTLTPSVYDAAMLWGLGVLATPAFNGDDVLQSIIEASQAGVEVSRDDLSALVQKTSAGDDVDYVGVSGSMDVRPDRTVPGSYFIERVIADGAGYAYEELTSPARVEK